jgi:hypothetical protein
MSIIKTNQLGLTLVNNYTQQGDHKVLVWAL